jgi:pilus assembly protein CpaB
MLLRVVLFAMMALGLGGFGLIAWVSTRPAAVAEAAPRPAEVEAEAKVEAPRPVVKVLVLVAGRAVRAGSLLKPEEITAREVAEGSLPPEATIDSVASRHALVGAMVRRPLAAGEPLVAGDLMRPGDHGFLAAVLAPGMRAVTIGVDAVSGTAGLIWPGDRVDVVMTQKIEDASLPVGMRVVAETVQHNTRVIAIDQQLVQGAVPGGAEGSTARTVTVEVTGEQVQRVLVAARIGQLSLSVRSSDSSESGTDNQSPTFSGDVSRALARQAPRLRTDVIRIHSGSSESKEYKL